MTTTDREPVRTSASSNATDLRDEVRGDQLLPTDVAASTEQDRTE